MAPCRAFPRVVHHRVKAVRQKPDDLSVLEPHHGLRQNMKCIPQIVQVVSRGPGLPVAFAVVMLVGSLFASQDANDWMRQVESANALVDIGDLSEAEKVYTEALQNAHAAGDEIRAGVILQNVGRLFERKGQLRDAERTYLKAVSSFAGAGVADKRLVIRAYAGLSDVYIQTGQYSKAETLIRHLLKDSPAGADSDRASLMGSLGVILAHRQKHAEAEQVLQQTAAFGAGDHSTEMQEVRAVAIANLAGIQMRDGRTAEALSSYRVALAMMDGLPNASPATLVVTIADYANVLETMDDRQAANDLYARALRIAQLRLGPAHPILGGLLQQYSLVLRRSGKKAEARTFANVARRIRDTSGRENLTGHTIPIEALMVGK